MKIGFAPVSTVEVKHVSLLDRLEQELNSFFQQKSYGEDLKELYIGVVVVRPCLDRLFKLKKPKYTFDYKNYIRNTISHSYGRAMQYRIKLNFEHFNNASETEARDMIKKELLNSINVFDRYKNKIKDFNVGSFRQDLGSFFMEVQV